jgi:hypothetical protein
VAVKNGDTIAMGASDAGVVYILVRSGDRWTLQLQAKLTGSGKKGGFGESVALDKDHLLVGAPQQKNKQGKDSGTAYVFARQGNQWTKLAELLPEDVTKHDYFGSDVDISGDTLVVGARGHDMEHKDMGAVYVYVYVDLILSQKLVPKDLGASALFGYSVALRGNTLVVGAPWGDPHDLVRVHFTTSLIAHIRSGPKRCNWRPVMEHPTSTLVTLWRYPSQRSLSWWVLTIPVALRELPIVFNAGTGGQKPPSWFPKLRTLVPVLPRSATRSWLERAMYSLPPRAMSLPRRNGPVGTGPAKDHRSIYQGEDSF